jgi:hypothetical protein
MTDSPTPPEQPLPRKDYEDPHYHDEDLEVEQDDTRRRPPPPPGKGKPTRRIPPPPKRRHED